MRAILVFCLPLVFIFTSCHKADLIEPAPNNQLTASFSVRGDSFPAPCRVFFTNESKNFDSCTWDFGTGDISHNKNAEINYVYKDFGKDTSFLVKLLVYRNGGKDSAIFSKKVVIQKVVNPPLPTNPDFTYTPTINLKAPIDITFEATSTDGVIYEWDFGDGTPMNTGKKITHTYKNGGIDTVKLTVKNIIGQSAPTVTKVIRILYPDPVANFTMTEGPYSLVTNIQLDASSSQNAVRRVWNFADGSVTDTSKTTSHKYTFLGAQTVTLTVYNADGKSNSKTIPITINNPTVFMKNIKAAKYPLRDASGNFWDAAVSNGDKNGTPPDFYFKIPFSSATPYQTYTIIDLSGLINFSLSDVRYNYRDFDTNLPIDLIEKSSPGTGHVEDRIAHTLYFKPKDYTTAGPTWSAYPTNISLTGTAASGENVQFDITLEWK